MGCCESRDLKQEDNNIHQPLQPQSLFQQAIKMRIQTLDKLDDLKAREVLEHALELEDQNTWISVLCEDKFSAKKLNKSKFNSKFVVTRLYLNLETLIPLKLLIDMLIMPESRKKWDTYIDEIGVLESKDHSYLVFKRMKVLFYSAEFMERYVITMDNDKVYIISYSIEEEFELRDNKSVKALTIMGMIEISEKCQATEMILISQTDPNSRMSFLAGTLGIEKQKSWIKSFKSKLLKSLNDFYLHSE